MPINGGTQLSSDGYDDRGNRSFFLRLVDLVFGYDFFISYSWRDGGAYAAALARRLQAEGFEVFLDRADFASGDDWKKIGAWTLRRTGQLVLVGSPAALVSAPVIREIGIFIGTGRRIVAIDFDGSLEWKESDAPLAQYLPAEILRIREPATALESGPSDETVASIRRTFNLVRQDKKRVRAFAIIALLLGTLAIAATWFGYSADKASKRALERSLAISAKDLAERAKDTYRLERAAAYAIEANARSVSADVWEAASLVADRLPARALNRGVDVRHAFFDGAGRNLLVGWVDGVVGIIEIDTGRWVIRAIRSSELADVAVSPDGQKLAAAWTDGEVEIFSGPDWHLASRTKVEVDAKRLEGLRVVLSENAAIAVTFLSPKRVAVAGADRVTVLDGSSASPLCMLPLQPYWGMWGSSDGRRLAVTDDFKTDVLDLDKIGLAPQVLIPEKASSFAWSLNGESFAWVDAKNNLMIFSDGRQIGPFAHEGWVRDIRFDSDGNHVITQTARQSGWSATTASGENVTRIFELPSGQELARLPHTHQPGPLAITRDGIIVSVLGSRLALMDKETFAEKAFLPHIPAPASFALSPSGRLLVTADYDGIVRAWDLDSGAWREVGYHEGPVRDVSFSMDGGNLVTVGGDRLGDQRVVHIDQINLVGTRRRITALTDAVAGFALDPSGGVFYVAASWPATGIHNVERFDLADGSSRRIWSTQSVIQSMTFVPDTGTLFVQLANDSLVGIDVANQKAAWTVTSARSPNGAPEIIGPGRFVKVNDASTAVAFLLDARTGKHVAVPGPGPHSTVLEIAPTGRFFAYLGSDYAFRLYTAGNTDPVRVFQPSSFFAGAFERDGRWFAVAEDPDIIRFVSLQNDTKPIAVHIGGKTVDIAFVPGQRAALIELSLEVAGGGTGQSPTGETNVAEIVLVEIETGRVRWRYRMAASQAGPTWKTISPSGEKLAIGGENRQGLVLDMASGFELLKLDFSSLVRTAAFDPTEEYVAFGSADGVVQFANLTKLRLQGVVRTTSDVWRVAFTERGKYLVVQSDQAVELFSVDPVSRLCERDGRNLSKAEWSEVGGSGPPPVSCKHWRAQ